MIFLMRSILMFVAGFLTGASVSVEYPDLVLRALDVTGSLTLYLLLGYAALIAAALSWMLARDSFADWRAARRARRQAARASRAAAPGVSSTGAAGASAPPASGSSHRS